MGPNIIISIRLVYWFVRGSLLSKQEGNPLATSISYLARNHLLVIGSGASLSLSLSYSALTEFGLDITPLLELTVLHSSKPHFLHRIHFCSFSEGKFRYR